MKKLQTSVILLLGIIIFLSSGSAEAVVQQNFLLTPGSVGDLRIGMTVAEARMVFKTAEFNQFNYGEEGVWVEVNEDEVILLSFTTDQRELPEDDEEGRVPIDEAAKIESIRFSDVRYKTADGVHPGITVREAEKRFGKIKRIRHWGYDGSEHVEFSNAPLSYSITIGPAAGSAEGATGGIYKKDEDSTTKYAETAVIESITVNKIIECTVITKTGNLNVREFDGEVVASLRKGAVVYVNSLTNDGARANIAEYKNGEFFELGWVSTEFLRCKSQN